MSARHVHAHDESAIAADWLVFCPNCGRNDHYRSNWVDEAPLAALAQYASLLRDCGETEAACDALTRLAAVRIANFVSYRWKCACGVRFDHG